MTPPRKELKEGDLVDGKTVTFILSDGDIQLTDFSGIDALADAIKNNGALMIVNVMGNKIGKEQLSKLQGVMQAHATLVSLCGIANDATEANLSGLKMDADDAVVLANELPAKGAMKKLTISGDINDEYGRLKSQLVTIETSMTEADFSNKFLGASGATMLAAFLPKCRALTSLNLESNNLGAEGAKQVAEAINVNVSALQFVWYHFELDLTFGSTAVVYGYSYYNTTKGALTSLNMSKNVMLTKEAGKALGDMLKANSVLKEMDVSSNYDYHADSRDGAGFAWGIADGVSNNGALVKLDASDNEMFGEDDKSGITAWAEAIKTNTFLTELNIAKNNIDEGDAKILGPATGASGALTSLNTSHNNVKGAEAGKAFAAALAENTVLKELDLSGGLDKYGRPVPNIDVDFTKEFAVGLSANGALTTLNISNNKPPHKYDGNKWISDMTGINALAAVIPECKALTSLNISNNNIGQLIPPEGWTTAKEHNSWGEDGFKSPEGKWQAEAPPGSKAEGAIALADGVKNNGALKKLLMAKNAIRGAEAGKVLGEMLAANTVLKELDLSDQGDGYKPGSLDAACAKELAIGLGANGALENLHIGDNKIPIENMNEIIDIVEAKPAMKVLCAVPFRDKTITELDVSGQSLGVEGALVIRRYLENNGALTSLNMSKNVMASKESGKALADVLKANTVLTDLDVSGNAPYSFNDGQGFAQELAIGVAANGALETITFGDKQAATMKTDMTEADLRGKGLGASEAIIVAAFLPKCQAMVSANLLNNNIDVQQAQNLAAVLKEHLTLKSLCGNKGNETELDMSGKKMGADGAIMLAPEIVANGALETLDVSNNKIISNEAGKEVGKALGNMLKQNTSLKALDISNNLLGDLSKSLEFIQQFAVGLGANGALASVNILKNDINVEQAQTLVEIMRSKNLLTTLCGLTGKEAELDFSKQGLGAGDAVLIANDIRDNGALKKLDISANSIGGKNDEAGVHALADALKINATITELNVADNKLDAECAEILAPAISANGALASLDLSQNDIPAEEMGAIERLCESKRIALRK